MLKFSFSKRPTLDLVERLATNKPILFAPSADMKAAKPGELLEIALAAVVATARKRAASPDLATAEVRGRVCDDVEPLAVRFATSGARSVHRNGKSAAASHARNVARIAEFAELLDRRELILPKAGWSNVEISALAVAAVALYAERGPAAGEDNPGEDDPDDAAIAEAVRCACLTVFAGSNVLAFLGANEAAAATFGDMIHSIAHLSVSRGPIVTPGEGWPDVAALEETLAASGIALFPH